jgi:L-lactate dehydrogenase (cytochrome)
MDDTRAIARTARVWGASEDSREARLRRRFPTIEALRRRAKRRVPKFAFDFVDGGEGSEAGIARNAAALQAIELVPRYSVDVDRIAMDVELFGRRYAAPIGIAPMGMGGLAWPGAEQYYAPAAQRARIPFVLASVGSASIEDIARLAPDVFWFQIYRFPRNDHQVTFDLMARAEAAGAHVLMPTVDTPVRPKRLRDLRNRLAVPFRPNLRTLFEVATSPAWVVSLLKHGTPRFENFVPYAGANPGTADLAGFAQREVRGSHSWDELKRMRDRWPRAFVVKGIMHPADAERAVALGADGILVSNHGGRQLDGAPATVDVLPAIVRAVGGRATVLLDSGVRTGLDVVRALALGAKAALAGRPFIFSLAALGPDGPRHVIDMLTDETRTALGQLGVCSLGDCGAIVTRHRGAIDFPATGR